MWAAAETKPFIHWSRAFLPTLTSLEMSAVNKDPLLEDRRGLSQSVSCVTFKPRLAFHIHDQISLTRGIEVLVIMLNKVEAIPNYDIIDAAS